MNTPPNLLMLWPIYKIRKQNSKVSSIQKIKERIVITEYHSKYMCENSMRDEGSLYWST
ncbi:hypothetical protein C0J52_09736 [Blattella germanica]|nr:hypothetical protein C0J52_09736 [Blattella germanica]